MIRLPETTTEDTEVTEFVFVDNEEELTPSVVIDLEIHKTRDSVSSVTSVVKSEKASELLGLVDHFDVVLIGHGRPALGIRGSACHR